MVGQGIDEIEDLIPLLSNGDLDFVKAELSRKVK